MAIKINGATVISDSQAITSTSTISATGNVTAGNVTTAGNLTINNVTLAASGTNLVIGGNTVVTANATGTSSTTGNVTISGNVAGGNISTAGTVTAASTVGGVITGTSTSVSGNVTGGNVATGGTVSATGNITGGNITPTGNIVLGDTKSISIGSLVITDDTIRSTEHNITIGSLGNIGNVIIGGNLTVNGNTTTFNSNVISTNDLTYNLANNATSSSQANGAGIEAGPVGSPFLTWLYNNTSNVWTSSGGISAVTGVSGASLSTSGTVSATGNITGGNISATNHTGTNVSVTGTVTAASTVGGVITGSSASVTGTVTGASLVGTVTTAAQGSITSLGTLTGLTINNATTAITNGASNGSGNIGASGATFNTVFAKATTAQYADLAEKYTADADYAPGTVLVFGGTAEVTVNASDADRRVAGVVSTDPGFLMNEGLDSEFAVAIALTGRVPCQVVGPVRKGDLMVAAGNGKARADADPKAGSIIGKALENFDGAEGTIEVVVGRF